MRQAAEAERLVTSAYANEAAASTEELRKVRHAQLRISLLQREQANAARMDAMVAGEKAARAARDALRKMTAEERKQPAKEIGEQLAAVAANLRGVHRGVAGCVGSSAGLPAHQEAASARRE